ncbi:thymidylate synthase [Sphingomonas oryzagri]|uniref:thymidylate synthase n=1 Tax=Sphingomonas oryzagri TaxID=3042314 RepID=A0ABT6N7N6_9SPHN|nr:thymidylate synthase [Sphingomonas oryzagri]MDH7641132.1 thymidylate synthase [Sphingomonas oryzagri]
MELTKDSLDDLLHHLYEALIADGSENRSNQGDSIELLGVTLRLTKPRSRLSRSATRSRPLSALGELLWYLAGSDEVAFMKPYIPSYGDIDGLPQVNGAYGPRIRSRHGFDQLHAVTEAMREKGGSRRTVIQLYEAKDFLTKLDVPCTLSLQFYRRGDTLHMSTMMRSNDAYLGVPHDIFCFTMIQELVAAELGLELGEYVHMVGSMHLYARDLDRAKRYLSEGFQRIDEMAPMPTDAPFAQMEKLLALETRIRAREDLDPGAELTAPYWSDLARLVQVIFAGSDDGKIQEISSSMSTTFYQNFIEDRRALKAAGEKRKAQKQAEAGAA